MTATALFAAGPAHAVSVGTVGATPYATSMMVPAGPVSEEFFFDIAAGFGPTSLSATELTLPSPLAGGADILSIAGLTLTLLGPADAVIASTATPGAGGFLEILASLLPDIDYKAKVSGTADGLSGGLFSFAIVASPTRTTTDTTVPEPGTLLLLLSGVVMLVAVTRRRMTSL